MNREFVFGLNLPKANHVAFNVEMTVLNGRRMSAAFSAVCKTSPAADNAALIRPTVLRFVDLQDAEASLIEDVVQYELSQA